jgi:polyhydroxyalkanoate synthase subunit PhaC
VTTRTRPPTDVEDGAASLDMLLIDAALGTVRQFLPDSSALKWGVALARRPRRTAGRLTALVSEGVRVFAGESDLAPQTGDRRFLDEAWTTNPLLSRLLQLYVAVGWTADQLVEDGELHDRDHKRVKFLVDNILHALAPSNVPLVNPTSAKTAIDTAGMSLVRGAVHLAKDLAAAPRVPEMVDSSGFQLGENIAATEGAVVFRSEMLELIQYVPRTEEVHEIPVLIVPPTINKFYAVDLAPGRSLVEFNVEQGRQVFVISWRNPEARHAWWDLEAYVRAVLDALAVVEEITDSGTTALAGVCSGGIIASIVAAYLSGTGRQDRLAAVVLAVTVIDQAGSGTVSALSDRRVADLAKARSAKKGYVDGRQLAELFAWLRPNDLVWHYWVNNYLLGKKPPAFDILF